MVIGMGMAVVTVRYGYLIDQVSVDPPRGAGVHDHVGAEAARGVLRIGVDQRLGQPIRPPAQVPGVVWWCGVVGVEVACVMLVWCSGC